MILAVVLFCILGIIGIPTSFDALRNSLGNRIRLGLDLSGGTHLILQVQVEDAVKVNSDVALERLRDRLTADGIPYDEVSKVTPVEILIRGIPQDAETRTTLSDLIRDELLEWDLSGPTVQDGVASWRVRMRVTAARAIRLDALQKAISTIRRRVDALGVTEPTIQEHGQGDYEILVQLPGVDEPERVKQIIQRT
ncbi:MAG: protein translocase subunit SecD, partial [Acidobacteriota bacterium]